MRQHPSQTCINRCCTAFSQLQQVLWVSDQAHPDSVVELLYGGWMKMVVKLYHVYGHPSRSSLLNYDLAPTVQGLALKRKRGQSAGN